ncbi:TlpA family protein disulfide reductase [Alicycliphilus denitrificans]|uniref:Redoxin domain protein n=2 Tax=Alicycliphilus denitrificans TaxID=179636 RepID=F4GF50_ALIDK|nr:TlpA disulfide reductase family protein [Alicycliphilus denitrificans]ADV01385.1 alkyl hydroperoxide reductase/ Thiol specific antioxidant/ Mal allergen [Alicycliphilus denitrificans BC]AEB86154.1 Redoxin domain protein [Alicycliphilus denitrificans K601]QKD45449.1 TlpA family protein disulfide reductase [Alicycliphilus denitrificans]GAO24936.1 redoxin domain-containing protein [Alicycliphilus sp. B1]
MNHPSENPTPETSQASASAARRRWLLLGVGAVAGLGGAGLAAWRLRPGAVKEGAHETLWDASFEDLGGQPLRMASMRGRPLLLNFWATWCPPCVQELPLLNAFYGEHRAKGWQVLGLAIDQPANVQKFLQRVPLDFPVALGGLGGTELSRSLGNDKGGLPFTVMFAADGSISKRKIGQLTAQDLQNWSKSL